MKKIEILFLCILFTIFSSGCSKNDITDLSNTSSNAEEIKSYIIDNMDYELNDLKVFFEEETKDYSITGVLGTEYNVITDLAPFTEQLIKVSELATEEHGSTIHNVSAAIYTGENTWFGWGNSDSIGSFYNQDKFISEDVPLENLQSEINKFMLIDTDTSVKENEIDERFGNMLEPFQGEWKSIKSNWHLIINGDKIDALFYENYGDTVEDSNHIEYSFDFDEDENLISVTKALKPECIYTINENGQLVTQTINNKVSIVNTYEKISDNIELPNIYKKLEPTIGMSELEVYNSTWGMPSKKNKTTTTVGNKEQWVYDNGYIYFENGYVTSIQKR